MEPKYVTFEQAVWLNNQIQSNKVYDNGVLKKKPSFSMSCISDYGDRYKFAPEQHQVVDWLLGKHGIWIYSLPMDDGMRTWQCRVIKGQPFSGQDNILKIITNGDISYRGLYSPQEAYSAAFDYIKDNNLI